MFRIVFVSALVILSLGDGARLRAADEQIVFDHLSLNVAQPADAAAWYAARLGARRVDDTSVAFGGVRFSFRASTTAMPTEGSVIDHVAFAFPDVQNRIREWQEAGIAVKAGDDDGTEAAFLTDPWGARIALLQDGSRSGFHHIHLLATNRVAMVRWLKDSFGVHARPDRDDWLSLPEGVIVVRQVDTEPAASAGRAIDHLGWAAQDLDATVAVLRAHGVTFASEPRTAGALRMAFVQGPHGLRVEVVQRQP